MYRWLSQRKGFESKFLAFLVKNTTLNNFLCSFTGVNKIFIFAAIFKINRVQIRYFSILNKNL